MSVQEPMELVKNCQGLKVFIKLRHGRHLTGKLHAYDEHLNVMLSKVEETAVEIKGDSKQKKEITRNIPILYMRGDQIVGISPIRATNMTMGDNMKPSFLPG